EDLAAGIRRVETTVLERGERHHALWTVGGPGAADAGSSFGFVPEPALGAPLVLPMPAHDLAHEAAGHERTVGMRQDRCDAFAGRVDRTGREPYDQTRRG